MRKVALLAAAMMAGSAMSASAQVMVDMSLVTCKQYLESDRKERVILASWMGGYFSASKNLSTVDFRYVSGTRQGREVLQVSPRRNAHERGPEKFSLMQSGRSGGRPRLSDGRAIRNLAA